MQALSPSLQTEKKHELTKTHRPTLRCNCNSQQTPNLRLILDPRNPPRSMLRKRKPRQHKRHPLLRQQSKHTHHKTVHVPRRMHRRASLQPNPTSPQDRLSRRLEQPNRRDTGTQHREPLPLVSQQHDDASPLGRPNLTAAFQQREHAQLHRVEWRD